MKTAIPYVSQSIADRLYDSVPKNIDRYLAGDFVDMAEDSSWSLLLETQYDPSLLQELQQGEGQAIEVENSIRVWNAFQGMTPALARENRIWVRLSHLDCLAFCRSRWLSNAARLDEGKLVDLIRKHFFAGTRTACRDDHAVSRLWWNAWIAGLADPEHIRSALEIILGRADTRLNLVERPWMCNRPIVASLILLTLRSDEWAAAKEENFRELMKAINLLGGGVAFEVMNDAALRGFMSRCLYHAKAVRNVALRKDSPQPTRPP